MVDYIIVGGGSSGCTLAGRLSEDPDVSVVMLEAGGTDRHPLFAMPAGFAKMTKGVASWGYATVPQKHLGGRVLWYTQAKVIGGGSSINAQIYTRGNAQDYDGWAYRDRCLGWSYADVLPYFKRAENNQRFVDDYHSDQGPLGVSVPVGPLPISEAFIRAGQQFGMPYNPDFNGAHQEGVGLYQLTIRDARRSSAASAYLRPARKRPNLEVRTGVAVLRVVIEQGRAVGVEIGENGGRTIIRCEREVLLTAGAINSPRLLMLSGIGPADHLRSVGVRVLHDLPGVGDNLNDHVNFMTVSECTGDHTYDGVARPHRTVMAGIEYLLTKRGPVASNLFEAGGFWFADTNETAPDIQFHLGLGSGIEAGTDRLKNAGVTLNSAYLRPRSTGTVRLASADPSAHPLIDPNYWAEPHDRAMSLEGLRMAREILRQDALKPFILAERHPGPEITSDADITAYAWRIAKTDHHPSGTCRMGVDDGAVVTPELKLRGVEGLRVCDASVMPRVISANTNASTIMIGEKASDLVRGRAPLPAANLPDAPGLSKTARVALA